jgi:hypothetical protein
VFNKQAKYLGFDICELDGLIIAGLFTGLCVEPVGTKMSEFFI